jgi:hypothetical protein
MGISQAPVFKVLLPLCDSALGSAAMKITANAYLGSPSGSGGGSQRKRH